MNRDLLQYVQPQNHLLLIILICVIVDHVEEPELVDALGRGDHTKPISQLLLLQEFLRPIEPTSAT